MFQYLQRARAEMETVVAEPSIVNNYSQNYLWRNVLCRDLGRIFGEHFKGFEGPFKVAKGSK